MLGFGKQQGDTTLSWPPLWCLRIKVSALGSDMRELAKQATFSLHPTLDVLVTSGRDASARVSLCTAFSH